MTDGKPIPKSELWEEYYIALHKAYNSMRTAFKIRARDGLTQDEIARRLGGVDKALISKRLNGRENLTLRTLSFMASAMGCRLAIFFVPYEVLGAVSYVDDSVAARSYVIETDHTEITDSASFATVEKALQAA